METDALIQVGGTRLGATQDVKIRETTHPARWKVELGVVGWFSLRVHGDALSPAGILQVRIVLGAGLQMSIKLGSGLCTRLSIQ